MDLHQLLLEELAEVEFVGVGEEGQGLSGAGYDIPIQKVGDPAACKFCVWK
jgi:hypothetical protein